MAAILSMLTTPQATVRIPRERLTKTMTLFYEPKAPAIVSEEPRMATQDDCNVKLRNLFQHLPLKSGADPEHWLQEFDASKPCDAIMPFLAVARNAVNKSRDTGATPYQTMYEESPTIERNLRRELYHLDGLRYFMGDFWKYRF